MNQSGLLQKIWSKVFHRGEDNGPEPEPGIARPQPPADGAYRPESPEGLKPGDLATHLDAPNPDPRTDAGPGDSPDRASSPAPAEMIADTRPKPSKKAAAATEAEVVHEGKIVETLNRLSDIPPAIRSAVVEAMREAVEHSPQRNEALKVLREMAEANQERNEAVQELLNEVAKHSEQLEGIHTALLEPTQAQTQAIEQLKRMREVVERLGEKGDAQARAVSDFTESWQAARKDLSEQFAQQARRMTQAMIAVIALLAALVVLGLVGAVFLMLSANA